MKGSTAISQWSGSLWEREIQGTRKEDEVMVLSNKKSPPFELQKKGSKKSYCSVPFETKAKAGEFVATHNL